MVDWDKYTADVIKTEPSPEEYKAARDRLDSLSAMRLLHAVLGIASEAGELVDVIKKYLFYGAPLDEVNIIEEIGDKQWYVALALDELSVPLNEVLEKNTKKLRARYGDAKFSSHDATNRDLKKERRILEGGE